MERTITNMKLYIKDNRSGKYSLLHKIGEIEFFNLPEKEEDEELQLTGNRLLETINTYPFDKLGQNMKPAELANFQKVMSKQPPPNVEAICWDENKTRNCISFDIIGDVQKLPKNWENTI